MGNCVEKLPHSCGSRKGLQIFEKEDGTYDGFCFSCDTYVPNPYEDRPAGYKPVKIKKTREEIDQELVDIGSYQTLTLKDRMLSAESLAVYGVKIGVSETDGVTPVTHHYPYTRNGEVVDYKTRVIHNKAMFFVAGEKDVDLFGWEVAVRSGSNTLYITEGELDAVSLYAILSRFQKEEYKDKYDPAVVSLIHGSCGGKRDIGRLVDKIRKHFKDIVLVFDNDEAGQKGIEHALKYLPEARVATLPEKDANACLVKGVARKAFNACVFNSKVPKNTRLVNGHDLHEKAKVPPQWGYSWPWNHLNEVTRGIRLGETIYIGAGQKQGKSEIVNTLAAWFITEHKWKVFLVKPEESNLKTYKMVAGKMVGRIFHDPKIDFDVDAYERAGGMIGDNLVMLNLYQHVGWDSLKADIRSAAAAGCKAVFIDPITNLTNGMNAADANTKLQEIAQELSSLALDLNIVIFIFCHLRNPDSGLPHERGGEVLSSQFAGSRAMARSCNLMLGLEGNRDPNLEPEERNLKTLVLLEDREFGENGRFKLYWDSKTSLFNEVR